MVYFPDISTKACHKPVAPSCPSKGMVNVPSIYFYIVGICWLCTYSHHNSLHVQWYSLHIHCLIHPDIFTSSHLHIFTWHHPSERGPHLVRAIALIKRTRKGWALVATLPRTKQMAFPRHWKIDEDRQGRTCQKENMTVKLSLVERNEILQDTTR